MLARESDEASAFENIPTLITDASAFFFFHSGGLFLDQTQDVGGELSRGQLREEAGQHCQLGT